MTIYIVFTKDIMHGHTRFDSAWANECCAQARTESDDLHRPHYISTELGDDCDCEDEK